MRIHTTIKFLQTKRVRQAVLLIFILIGPHHSLCYSQDLYDKEHSQKFAEYLSSSQQHALAAEEYERLVYFDNNSVGYKYNLIKSYRLSGDLKSGIKRIYSFYGRSLDTMPQILASEFVKLELLADSLPVAGGFINQQSKLSFENKAVFHSYNLLLSGQYKEASLYAEASATSYPAFPAALLNLSQKAGKIKLKSPFIAAGFSAVIPGTGKFYTRNWSDGLFSLLFVAGNAWQAYRGFNEHGVKSGYGWAFASLSASFYIGNIIGAAKAAKRYNKNRRNEVDNQVFEFVRTDSF